MKLWENSSLCSFSLAYGMFTSGNVNKNLLTKESQQNASTKTDTQPISLRKLDNSPKINNKDQAKRQEKKPRLKK